MTYAHDAAMSTSNAPTLSYNMEPPLKLRQRLDRIERERQTQRQEKRQEDEDGRNPDESAETFLAGFSEGVAALTADVAGLTGEAAAVRRRCAALLLEVKRLDGDVSKAAYFLPSYDVRQCRLTLHAVKKRVEEAEATLAPKKRFAFSKKTAPRGEETATDVVPAPVSPSAATRSLAHRSLDGRVDEEVRLEEADLGSRGFELTNCSGCRIWLKGRLLALQLRNLRACRVVLLGHVKGATMMFDLERCEVHLASAQVRVHNSRDTTLRLRVRSTPIIEDSTAMRFGPLSPAVEADRKVLEEEGVALCEENGLWSNVNDFNWLKESPSPNW